MTGWSLHNPYAELDMLPSQTMESKVPLRDAGRIWKPVPLIKIMVAIHRVPVNILTQPHSKGTTSICASSPPENECLEAHCSHWSPRRIGNYRCRRRLLSTAPKNRHGQSTKVRQLWKCQIDTFTGTCSLDGLDIPLTLYIRFLLEIMTPIRIYVSILCSKCL